MRRGQSWKRQRNQWERDEIAAKKINMAQHYRSEKLAAIAKGLKDYDNDQERDWESYIAAAAHLLPWLESYGWSLEGKIVDGPAIEDVDNEYGDQENITQLHPGEVPEGQMRGDDGKLYPKRTVIGGGTATRTGKGERHEPD